MPSSKPVEVIVEGEDGRRKTMMQGRWSREEHEMFVRCFEEHGRQWKRLAEVITTRTVLQIRTHAQKYFNKLSKAAQKESGKAPPPRSRRNSKQSTSSRQTKRTSSSSSSSKRIQQQEPTPPTSLYNPMVETFDHMDFSRFGASGIDSVDASIDAARKRKEADQATAKRKRSDSTATLTLQHSKKQVSTPWDDEQKFDMYDDLRWLSEESSKEASIPTTSVSTSQDDDSSALLATPRKFNPTALPDMGSPLALTDLNDFLYSGGTRKAVLDGPPDHLYSHSALITSSSSSSSSTSSSSSSSSSSTSYRWSDPNIALPIKSELHREQPHNNIFDGFSQDPVELDIQTFARISEGHNEFQFPTHDLLGVDM